MKVYLAGPDVFVNDAHGHFQTLKKICADYGFEGLSPFDNEIKSDGCNPREVSRKIYEANLKLIRECDIVVANIEPFRGAHMDPGTAFEIGFAVALGKKIYAYSPGSHLSMVERITVLDFTHVDVAGVIRDSEANAIEDFGDTENLMITNAAQVTVHSFLLAVEHAYAEKVHARAQQSGAV